MITATDTIDRAGAFVRCAQTRAVAPYEGAADAGLSPRRRRRPVERACL